MMSDEPRISQSDSPTNPWIGKAAMFIGFFVAAGGAGMFAAGGLLTTGFGRLGFINTVIGAMIWAFGFMFDRRYGRKDG